MNITFKISIKLEIPENAEIINLCLNYFFFFFSRYKSFEFKVRKKKGNRLSPVFRKGNESTEILGLKLILANNHKSIQVSKTKTRMRFYTF